VPCPCTLFIFSRHHNNTRLGNGIAVSQVRFGVIADRRTISDYNSLVDYRLFDLDVTPDGDVFKQNRVFNKTVAVNLAERAEDGTLDGAAAGDAAGANV